LTISNIQYYQMNDIKNIYVHLKLLKKKLATSGVINYKSQTDLQQILNLDNLIINTEDQLLEFLTTFIKHSVNTNSRFFMNQLYSSSSPMTNLADLITTVMNNNMNSYEESPVLTIIQKLIKRELISKIKYSNSESEVIFNQGDHMSNILAMFRARHKKNPKISKFGSLKSGHPYHTNSQYRIYVSDHAHDSFEKGAMMLGIGSDNIIKVPTKDGKMDTKMLRFLIVDDSKKKMEPLMVVCTMGTSILGAYDDLADILDIAKEFKLWCHVDGSYGFGLIYSQKPSHQRLFEKINETDSVSWNPDKMFSIPLQSSFLMLRQKTDTTATTTNEMLNLPIDYHRGDILKYFIHWKINQTKYSSFINTLYETKEMFTKALYEHPVFCIYKNIAESFNVCIGLRHGLAKYRNDKISKIHKKLILDGKIMVSSFYLEKDEQILRFVFLSELSPMDIKYIVQQLEQNYSKVSE
jgi:hypothetical protein